MSGKAEFHESVGQAVFGNVHEAPRLSNIIKLSIGGEAIPLKPITNLQRRAIATKVKELVALGEIEQLDVYRVILNDFGADTIAELARDRYKDAMTLLDAWIVELTGDTAAQNQTPPIAAVAAPVPIDAPACTTCAHHAKQARDARLTMAAQTVMMLLLAVACWWLWQTPAVVNPVPNLHCHVDGKTYSIGSAVKMASGALRECVQDTGDGVPYWGVVQKTRGR